MRATLLNEVLQGDIPDDKWVEVIKLAESFRVSEISLPNRDPVAHLYVRCSHRDSAESGLGLESQKRACEGYLKELQEKIKNLQVGDMYVDAAVSAWRKRLVQRPEGRRMNAALRRGDHVIIARLDRGFRSMADMVMQMQSWEHRGILVHFATERFDPTTPMGWLTMHMLAAFAQMQSMYISARTKEGLAEAAKFPGKRGNGSAKYGYRTIGKRGHLKTVPVAEDRRWMKIIWEMKQANPSWSWRTLANRIEEMLAKEEDRKPVPHWDDPNRRWPYYRCRRVCREYPLLMEEERIGKAKLEARLADERARKAAREAKKAAKANAASK